MKKRGQGIVKVAHLFEKYKKTLHAPQKTIINQFIEVVGEIFPHTPLKYDQCSYAPRTKILSLRINGAFKTEILLKKKVLLEKMREVLNEKNTPVDII